MLRNVGTVDFSTKILGFNTSMPVYITATALGQCSLLLDEGHTDECFSGKLGHPEGEVVLTKAAAEHDVIQMVSTNLRTLQRDPMIDASRQIPTLASCGFDEMVDAAAPGQIQFLQLYVNSDRSRTKKIISHAAERGVKALFITVDAPQLGRREKV